ncbi:ATP-binding protein [Streptomyces sp. NPDC056534]|uniref:ATP-binding protein n=1 Tax=Streptomyces sp. NPDC056534 TaxID=3345857 RepID=UPI00369D7FCF
MYASSRGSSDAGFESAIAFPASYLRAGTEIAQSLDHRSESVCIARRIARAVLTGWHVGDERIEVIALLVSELVTNAVEHATPPIILRLHREHGGKQLWIGVSDGGIALTKGSWVVSCTSDEHGRGLQIVDTLAVARGTLSGPDGSTHWARVLLQEGTSSSSHAERFLRAGA